MTISSLTGSWDITSDWPWPQIWFTDYYVVTAAKKGSELFLWELTLSANDWIAVELENIGNSDEIISVDVASFDKFYLVSVYGEDADGNEWNKMFSRYPTSVSGPLATALVDPTLFPHGNSVCNYKGQIIVGGISTTYPGTSSLGVCSVAWAGIGNTEFNIYEDSSAGFMKMPWDYGGTGLVYKVLRLGDSVQVYGNNGTGQLIPFSQNGVTGFGYKGKRCKGILSPNAVAGDETAHCYIDNTYHLWYTTEKEERKIGYYDHLKLLSDDLLIRFDSTNRRFYISDGSISYVFNETGLYSTHQAVSSIGVYATFLLGFVKSLEASPTLQFKTTTFDIGYQSMKTLEAVELGVTYETSTDEVLYGSVDVKYDYKGSFIESPSTVLNERGIFTRKITGREFKINLLAAYVDDGEFSLNSIVGKVKFSDKRNIRGRMNVN